MNTKTIIIIILFAFAMPSQWIDINSSEPKSPEVNIVDSSFESTTISFRLNGFYLNPIEINGENYNSISFPESASMLEQGNPNLPKVSSSIIISNDKKVVYEILSSEYIEYKNIKVAPSKGNFSRNIDPSVVPYQFSSTYNNNSFFPEEIISLSDPYILRDFRGVSVQFSPIQYNPKTMTLRVYKSIELNVISDEIDNINIIESDYSFINKIDKDYNDIYSNHFSNFDLSNTRFDYLVDHGNMLIISESAFMSTMEPFVDWKNLKGISTEMVSVSNIGANASSIANYVENYYYSNGLTFLLLVGDIAQIPSTIVSGSASDVSYGCIEGNDFYPEVIVGRFSGNNPSEILTQVERSINYERYPQANVEWYDNALGVASNQGPGFQNMSDDVFSQFLWDSILSDFTYDSYQGVYDGSGGSDSQGISAINGGVSIVNYTGHGSISSWGNGASLNNTQINQLTNNNKLPFVITVGCNVGEFNSTNACYAETWQRATNGNEPTGGIAHFGSTISQSWEPPMHGQYAMNLIITESYDNNLTRSLGGIATNGCMYMNDAQGSNGINETKYWTFFGDPSLNIRTAPPSDLSVNHDGVILISQEEYVVDVGEDGALVALSRNGELLSSAYTVGGVAVLNLGNSVDIPGQLDLVVSGFNSFTYESEVMVVSPQGSYLMIDDIEVQYGLVENGFLLYGQNNNLGITLSNVGSDSASNISVELSVDNPFVSLIEGTVNYNNINPNQTVDLDGLVLYVDSNALNDEIVNLTFQISSDDDSVQLVVPFTIQAPNIGFNSMSGSLSSGETSDLTIALFNSGSAAINYPIVSLEGDMYVTVNSSGINNAYYWDYLQGNNQENLNANVSVSSSAPIGHVAELTIRVNNLNGDLDIVFPINVAIGQITENFESGFSDILDWEFSGDSNWEITTTDQYEGFYSAKSGQIENNQNTDMSVTLDVVIDGQISFYYRVASEYSPSGLYFYDGLEFYIDNQMVGQYSPDQNGNTPWTFASFPVESGTHTFTWSYIKDGGGGSTDMPEDCSWIDYITFPPASVGDGSILGDMNGDGSLNVQDIVMIINMVIGNSESDSNADINMDGTVDVLDIVLVVNIVLGS